MMENIKEKLNQKKYVYLMFIILISFVLFFSISLIMKSNSVYELKANQINDRFFSYDDIYYGTLIFNQDENLMNNLLYSAVKHPLLLVGANIFDKVENMIVPDLIFDNHYFIIVSFQILISIIGVCFLYLTLVNVIKLDEKKAFLLSLIYIFANATLISTILIESFVYSAALLIMSYYFIATKRYIISGVLGVLVFGTTVTNVVIWGLMVVFIALRENYKSIIKIGLSFIVTFLIVFSLLYIFYNQYLNTVIDNFISIVIQNKNAFSMDYGFFDTVKRGFYYLFISSFFYIDIQNTNQLGQNLGNSISFVPSANIFIVIVGIILLLVITVLLLKPLLKNKDKNIITCFSIILFNIILHCFLKFGIHEGFLYTPHFLFVFIILFSFAYKYYPNYSKYITLGAMTVFFFELIFNFKSIFDMIKLVNV